MNLGDFNAQEQLVLCALVKHLVRSDGQLTEEEIDAMSHVAAEMGQDAWRTAFRQVHGQRRSTAEMLDLAATVGRADVRTRILAVLQQVAESDSLTDSEADFLEAVADRLAVG